MDAELQNTEELLKYYKNEVDSISDIAHMEDILDKHVAMCVQWRKIALVEKEKRFIYEEGHLALFEKMRKLELSLVHHKTMIKKVLKGMRKVYIHSFKISNLIPKDRKLRRKRAKIYLTRIKHLMYEWQKIRKEL